jgi:hypothetical protein
MSTSYNPQAAEQARSTYRDVTAQLGLLGLDTAIPNGVRSLAETAVAQTRDAYDRSQVALDASIATFENSFDTAGRSATAFNRKIIDLARRNIDSVFDLAESLSNAKNLTEIVELQAAYWQKQFSLLSVQAREVGRLSNELTDSAGGPVKTHSANAKHGPGKVGN